MALSDLAIRKAKPKAKPWKLADAKGLYLLVTPGGSKLWKLKFRFLGREKKLSFGPYPEVSLTEARRRRDQARTSLAEGADPARLKQQNKRTASVASANTFELVAEEYIAKITSEGRSEATVKKARWFLKLLKPRIGSLPINSITPAELLACLRITERAGRRETARRLRSFANRVFLYAISTVRAEINPAQLLAGALATPIAKHHPGITDRTKLGEFLRAIDSYAGNASTQFALKLAPMLYQRPSELRKAEWSEIDFGRAVWRIPAGRMKVRGQNRPDHLVPLSSQALDLFRQLYQITGDGRFVFPGVRSRHRPISENTVNAAYRRLGFSKDEVVFHGLRTTASTFLYESRKWTGDAIERALAHLDRNQVRDAYNRSEYWDERVAMAQWWSDFLDDTKSAGEVVSIYGHAA